MQKDNEIKIASDLKQCHELWEKFSPYKTLWDEWNINAAFYEPKFHDLMFMYTNNSLLPLMYNHKEKRHEFFGDRFLENRTLWIHEKEIDLFFNNIPANTYLFDLNQDCVENLLDKHNFSGFEHDSYRNFLRFSHEEFLQTRSPKHRRNFLSDINRLDYISLTVEPGAASYFDQIVEFKQTRFNEESDFIDPEYVAAWKKISTFPGAHFIVAKTDKVVGVEMIIIHKNILYVPHFGYDISISNLGKLLIWKCLLLKESMQLDEVDFMGGINDWKERWNFEREKFYTFHKSA